MREGLLAPYQELAFLTRPVDRVLARSESKARAAIEILAAQRGDDPFALTTQIRTLWR